MQSNKQLPSILKVSAALVSSAVALEYDIYQGAPTLVDNSKQLKKHMLDISDLARNKLEKVVPIATYDEVPVFGKGSSALEIEEAMEAGAKSSFFKEGSKTIK